MKNLEKIIGYILLIPGLLSVLVFLINLLIDDAKIFTNLSRYWVGYGEATSALPFYFGLMSIAGASLIKGSSKE